MMDVFQQKHVPEDRKSAVRNIKKRSASPLGSYIGPEFLGRPPAKVEKKEEDGTLPPMKRLRSSMRQSVVPFRPMSFPHDDDDTSDTMIVDDRNAGRMDHDDPVVDRGLSRLSTLPRSPTPPVPRRPAFKLPKAEPEEPEITRLGSGQPRKTQDIVIKVKKDLEFDSATVQGRIDAAGVKPYTVDLDPEIKDAVVSRQFISSVYGGSAQMTFPHFSAKKFKEHGLKDFMFLRLEGHPNAPQEAGMPGVWFLEEPYEELRRSRDGVDVKKEEEAGEEEDRPEFEPKDEPDADRDGGEDEKANDVTDPDYRTFVGLSPKQWRYVGQYKLIEAAPLTQQEWILQDSRVRKTWAGDLYRYGWGTGVRFRVLYRREHGGEEPSLEEVRAAWSNPNGYKDVTDVEIQNDFDLGKQQLGVFVMRCVGYDEAFQRSLIERFNTWTPSETGNNKSKKKRVQKPKKASSGTKAREPTTSKTRTPIVVEDDDGDGDVEEIAYVPKGTRSRPGIRTRPRADD
ncbi:hypothetical protein OF83DRAFT_522787 [Amylostereum chailletii]|nr:hypothetical protein OF83DRAFT_522787 [Amylostereum chailletii]